MKHRNIAKTRTIIKQGYIPESFISFYRAQLVPSILSDSLFDSMISKFRESLNIVIRIIKFDISHKISEELSEFINSQPSLECEKLNFLGDQFGEIYRLNIDNPKLRREQELQSFREWLMLNTRFGNIVRQEFVSMIPSFFLDLKKSFRVLDCCASPGSKTSQIINYICDGLLVANDVNINRCFTLAHTLRKFDTT